MNNKRRSNIAQSSQAKGKETMSVELSGDVHSKAKRAASIIRSLSFFQNSTPSETVRWSLLTLKKDKILIGPNNV